MDLLLAIIHWKTNPEIFTLGNFALRYYSLLFGIAFLLGYYIFVYFFNTEKKNPEHLDPLLMYMFLSVVIGARLGHCLFYEPQYYLANPLEILMPWKGGLASHGALIGIFTGMYLFSRKYKYPFIWIMDRIAVVVALSGLFIRLGNFFNHEIVGMPTDGTWGVIFYLASEDRDIGPTPRHPVQLYESFSYFLIFLLLFGYYIKNKGKIRPGVSTGWFMVLVFGSRIINEAFKESEIIFAGMKTGQLLSIPAVLVGAIVLYFAYTDRIKFKNDFGKISPK
jgi:prolipoprotein diacylglyceryl transferase